jgi:hypothetical protein
VVGNWFFNYQPPTINHHTPPSKFLATLAVAAA